MKITSATNKHIKRIIEIADQTLGQNYMNPNLSNKLHEDTSFIRVALINGKDVVGFCYSYITTGEQMAEAFSSNKNSKATSSSHVGVIKTIAINPQNMKQGIATALIKDSINVMQLMQVKIIICTAWKREHGPHLNGLLLQQGFQVIDEIPNYWKADSLKAKYDCPICGNPCCCKAVIYLREE